MAYCTLEDFKEYAGIEAAETSDDTLLESLLDAAQQRIDTHCKRRFEATADTTRNFDARPEKDGGNLSDDFRVLYLDEDLCQLTTVTNGDSTTVTSSQYVTEPRNRTPYYALRLKDSASISWTYDTTPENAISIAGRWAWSLTAPDDIVMATKRLTHFLYKQKDTAIDLERPVLSSGGQMIMPIQLPKDVEALLKIYRKFLV